MNRTAALAAVLTAVLLLPACAADDSSSPGSASSPSETETETDTTTAAAEASPFEGTWTTDLTREAVRAYIRKQGWSKKVEKAIMKPDMVAPPTTVFRIDFADGFFRMALDATDEQWMSGTFRLEDGRIYLDDEAPVGETTFAYHLDGDTMSFDDPGDTSDPDNEIDMLDGAPVWTISAVLLSSTPWTRVAA